MIDMRPSMFARSASRHNSNVSSGNSEQFFFFTAYLRHDGFGLASGRDMVTFRYDGQKICANRAQIHSVTPNLQFTAHQLVVSIEINNELTKNSADQRRIIRHPSIHRVPGFHLASVLEIVAEFDIVADVVFYRLECLSAGIDHLTRHVPKPRQYFVDVEIALIHPFGEGDSIPVRKIQWRS